MPVNDPFAELTGFSSTKGNVMTIVAYTGAQISSLASTAVDGQVVYCYSTGSGYTQGHWYGWDDILAGGTWVDLNGLPDFYDFWYTNRFKAVIDRRAHTKEMWHNVFSGTGAAINNTAPYVDLVTGTTTTGVAMLQLGSPQIDWGKKVHVKLKVLTPAAATGQIVKLGVNIDKAGTGPVTTKNFGVEYCDGDTDWQIHSADGTTQSNFDTAVPATAATTWGIDMVFTPGVNVVVIFDDGTTATTKTKTTNIPSSGAGIAAEHFKLSISNNNGSTTSRTLQIMSAWMSYSISDSRWDT